MSYQKNKNSVKTRVSNCKNGKLPINCTTDITSNSHKEHGESSEQNESLPFNIETIEIALKRSY